LQQKRILILSDGKPGHLNQSIAFARNLGCLYEVSEVSWRSRWAKAFSYLADRLRLRLSGLFLTAPIEGEYLAVVSAGSGTYYANRVVAQELGCKSVAIMLPKGYRFDFDLIVAQQHDTPPAQKNIITLPINLSYVEPQQLVKAQADRKYVSVIVGGDSQHGVLDPDCLAKQLDAVFKLLPEHDFWLTTSRRTSPAVEKVLRQFNWAEAIYFSQQQINPIADFIASSEYLFVTDDSSSMISEAVSSGAACVEILPSADVAVLSGKLGRMVSALSAAQAVHLFDGTLGAANVKIDLAKLLQGVQL